MDIATPHDPAAVEINGDEVISGLQSEIGRMVGQIHILNARLSATQALVRKLDTENRELKSQLTAKAPEAAA